MKDFWVCWLNITNHHFYMIFAMERFTGYTDMCSHQRLRGLAQPVHLSSQFRILAVYMTSMNTCPFIEQNVKVLMRFSRCLWGSIFSGLTAPKNPFLPMLFSCSLISQLLKKIGIYTLIYSPKSDSSIPGTFLSHLLQHYR